MVVVSNTLSLLPFSILPIITPWLANRKGIRRDYFFASSRSQLALMKAKGGSQVGKRRWKKEGDVGFFSRWKVNRDCVSYAIGIGIGIGFLIFLGIMTYREEEEGERARFLVEEYFQSPTLLALTFFFKKKGGGLFKVKEYVFSSIHSLCFLFLSRFHL